MALSPKSFSRFAESSNSNDLNSVGLLSLIKDYGGKAAESIKNSTYANMIEEMLGVDFQRDGLFGGSVDAVANIFGSAKDYYFGDEPTTTPTTPEDVAAARSRVQAPDVAVQGMTDARYKEALAAMNTELDAARPDYSDLIAQSREEAQALSKQTRDDAFYMALMQLGAGIAGGDTSKGLEGAARAMMMGTKDARNIDYETSKDLRRLEVDAERQAYEDQRREKEFGLTSALQAYGIDVEAYRAKAYAIAQSNKDKGDRIREINMLIDMLQYRSAPEGADKKLFEQEKAKKIAKLMAELDRLMGLEDVKVPSPNLDFRNYTSG
jgi:hypothetical protein